MDVRLNEPTNAMATDAGVGMLRMSCILCCSSYGIPFPLPYPGAVSKLFASYIPKPWPVPEVCVIVIRFVVDEYETLYLAPTGTSTASNLVWICEAKADAEY